MAYQYTTTTSAHYFLRAAALSACHQAAQHCDGRDEAWVTTYIKGLSEIDHCATMGAFFGKSALLAAQGSKEVDIRVPTPEIQAEVKYVRARKAKWEDVKKDWAWLLTSTPADREKRAWFVFFPSTSLVPNFRECISISRGHGAQYALNDFEPFIHFVEPEMPANGQNQRLKWKAAHPTEGGITTVAGGQVKFEVIGARTHPVWCVMYTCVASAVHGAVVATSAPIVL